jgi:hypothetical protein
VRKPLLTPWGMIAGLRLPRLRDVGRNQEVTFLSSERAESRLAALRLTWGHCDHDSPDYLSPC